MNDRVQQALQQSRVEQSECYTACSLCSARVAVMPSLESGVKISSVNTLIFNFYDVRISIREKQTILRYIPGYLQLNLTNVTQKEGQRPKSLVDSSLLLLTFLHICIFNQFISPSLSLSLFSLPLSIPLSLSISLCTFSSLCISPTLIILLIFSCFSLYLFEPLSSSLSTGCQLKQNGNMQLKAQDKRQQIRSFQLAFTTFQSK